MSGPAITLAVGRSARLARIDSQRELLFARFAELLQRAPAVRGSLSLAEYWALKAGTDADKARAAADKDGQWWSAAKFAVLRRARKNVESVSAFVADVDIGNLSRDDIAARLPGLQHVAYTTYSSSATERKWRVVVPYSRPASPAEHGKAFEYFRSVLPIDESTKDPCRLWYFPGRTCADTGAERELIARLDGAAFDIDAMIAGAPVGAAPLPAPASVVPLPATVPLSQGIGLSASLQRLAAMVSADALSGGLAPRDDWFEALTEPEKIAELRAIAATWTAEEATQRETWFRGVRVCADAAERGVPFDAALDVAEAFSKLTTAGNLAGREVIERKMREAGAKPSVYGAAIAAEQAGKYEIPSHRAARAEASTANDAAEGDVPCPVPGQPDQKRTVTNWTGAPIAAFDPCDPPAGYIYSDWGGAESALTKRFGILPNGRSGLGIWDSYRRAELTIAAFDRLYMRHMPKPKNEKESKPRPSDILIHSGQRRELRDVMFWPGMAPMFQFDGAWFGNKFTGAPSDEVPPTREARRAFVRFLRHLFPKQQGVRSRPWLKNYFDALAYLYQKPGERIATYCTLLTGETEGSGKTTLMSTVPAAIFGHRNVTAIDRELHTDFNSYLNDTQILVLEEMCVSVNRQEAVAFLNLLKPLITGHATRVVGKGKDGRTVQNCVTFFGTSNFTSDVLVLSDSARRFAVENTAAGQMPDAMRYTIGHYLRQPKPGQPAGPGGAMLRHWLRRRDVSRFDPYARPPETEALRQIKEDSTPQEQRIIERSLESGILSRGYGTIEDVEQEATSARNYSASFRIGPQKWHRHLEAACRARGLSITDRRHIQALPGRPRYRFWYRDPADLRQVVARFKTFAANVARAEKHP